LPHIGPHDQLDDHPQAGRRHGQAYAERVELAVESLDPRQR
jgi:hypothetical protein